MHWWFSYERLAVSISGDGAAIFIESGARCNTGGIGGRLFINERRENRLAMEALRAFTMPRVDHKLPLYNAIPAVPSLSGVASLARYHFADLKGSFISKIVPQEEGRRFSPSNSDKHLSDIS